ncbi:MAG: TRAP transporter substrate-binding protein [Alphaproteobacteria bacterium]|nr:TRAP transporter substrate-binding protein [Alphaproteobacteria bacterium]
MKRRDFLTGAGVGLAVGAAGAYALGGGKPADGPGADSGPAAGRKRESRQWKMVTSWPKNMPGLGVGAERCAERITRLSEGELTVKVFAAGELVPAFECFDSVSQGVAELAHTAPYYWQGKSKAANFFASVPFGLTAAEQTGWIRYGGGQELWDELYAKFNLKGFIAGNSGTQMGGWFNRKIRSIQDFKGLKMRMPGLGAEVLRRVGAAAVNISGTELFAALQTGAIDATEWIGPWNDVAFGFHKISKYYYGPGFHEPGTTLELMVNLEKYNALPQHLKDIIAAACQMENDEMVAEYAVRNAMAMKTLKEEHQVEVEHFPDDVVKALWKAAQEVLAELEGVDDITGRTYRSFTNFRKYAMQYGPYGEAGYLRMRELGAAG